MTSSVHNTLARIRSRIMYGACIACTLAILAILVLVPGYLLSIGWQSLTLSFFTHVPIPLGMPGAPGGMRNALIGTIMLILLASVVGVPLGMLTGIYLS